MIVLDTNVVSEPMKARGSPAVKAWLDGQVADTLYLAATSLAELMVGIEILPASARRDSLQVWSRCWRICSERGFCPSIAMPP
jgi:predicted nucleic acid-binding protein